MCDVPHNRAQQYPERTFGGRTVEVGMTHPRADAQFAVSHCQLVERGDGGDVNQVRRARQTERHHRHQALAARQHPAVLRRQLGEQPHGMIQAGRAMIGEWRRLHRPPSRIVARQR